MQNGFLLPSQNQDVFFHHVTSGDTLSKIISEYFPDNTQGMDLHIQQVLADNPEVSNADLIKPGQLLVLRSPNSNMCLAPIDQKESGYVKNLWQMIDPSTQQAIKTTSPWYNGLSLGIAGGGATMFTLENTLKSNMHLLNGVPDAYHKYKQGGISKYEFDKIRKAKLDQYSRNIGPAINKLVHGEKPVHNNFKLKPGRSLNATSNMTQHMEKLSRVSKAATTGGAVLAGVGLTASCYQISQTESQTEKNEIAVSSLTSTGFGLATGLVAGVILAGTPIGWVTILAIGTTTAFASWGVGEFSKDLYKTHGANADVVGALGINKICN